MADNTIGVLFRITGDIAQGQRALRDLSLAFDGNFVAIDRLLKRFKDNSKASVDSSAADFEKLAKKLNTSVPELQKFIEKFRALGSESERIKAALRTFGGGAADVIPQLEKLAASTEEAGAAAATAGAGFAALAGPIGIALAVIGALVVATAGVAKGLFDLALKAADTGKKLSDLSEKSGLSIRNINLLRTAAVESGKGFDVIERALDRFLNNLAKGEETGGRTALVLKKLGIDATEALKDPNKAFEQIVVRLNSFESAARRSAITQEIFGQKNEALVPILSRLGTDLEAYRERVERLTGKVTPEAVKEGKSFSLSLGQLSLAVRSVGETIGRLLIPTLQPLIDLLTTIAVGARQLAVPAFALFTSVIVGLFPELNNLGLTLDILNATLQSIPEIVVTVIKSFQSFGPIAEATGRVFKGLGVIIAAGLSGNLFLAQSAFETLKADASNLVTQVALVTTRAAADVSNAVGKHLTEILENRKRLQKEIGEGDIDLTKQAKNAVDEAARAQLAILDQRRREAERIARAEVELARQAFEQKEISLQDYENAVVRAENERLKVEKEIFAEERTLIEASRLKGPEKARRNEEVAQAEREAERRVQEIKDRIETERRKREEEARKEIAKRREQANEVADNAEIERLKALGEQRQITFEQMEQRVGQITEDGFERRRKLFEAEKIAAGANLEERAKVAAQIEKLNEEEALSAEQRARRIVEAQLKDLDSIKRLGDERRKLNAEINRENLEIERLAAQQLARNPFKQVEAAEARAELERKLANERSRIRIEELETERAFEEGENEILGFELHNTSRFNALIEAEKRRHVAELKNIDAEALHALRALDPGSGLSIFGEAGQQKLDETGSKFQGFAASVGAAFSQVTKSMGTTQDLFHNFFGSMAQGLGSLIQNFILTGKTGPAAFKQLAAGVIASLVAQAAVKSIFEVAEGIADLAKANAALASFNIPAAVQFQAAAAGHFAAAKVYGIIAGVGTVAAAALGAAGRGTGGSGGNAGGNNNDQRERTIIQGDPRQSFAPQIIILRMEPGIIAEKVSEQYQANAGLRQVIRNDIGVG